MNYGWIDLRDHPERVLSIPEARKSDGLAEILTVIAQPSSIIMSGACECGAFDQGPDAEGPRWHAGGFVTIMFKDAGRNVDPQNLVDLAHRIVDGFPKSSSRLIMYEMIVEPLKLFFGRTDGHGLMLKPLGFGPDEATAREAFEYAATAAAAAIELCVDFANHH